MHATCCWMIKRKITAVLIALIPFILLGNEALSAPAVAPGANSGNSKIIKWVDEKGITHYGDTMPSQYSGRDNSIISNQGVVLKHNQQAKPQAENLDKENLEQQRRDYALIATYTTHQEIDLARDRNLQADEIAVQGLQQNMVTAKARLATNQKTAQSYTARKKPVPVDLTQDLQANQVKISKIEAQITQRQTNMDATRQRFESDKRRFTELKSGESKSDANTTSPTTSQAPATAVVAKPVPTVR